MAQIAEVDVSCEYSSRSATRSHTSRSQTAGTYVIHRVVNGGYPVTRLWTSASINMLNFDLRIVNASDSAGSVAKGTIEI
jgi:hypothetical protein